MDEYPRFSKFDRLNIFTLGFFLLGAAVIAAAVAFTTTPGALLLACWFAVIFCWLPAGAIRGFAQLTGERSTYEEDADSGNCAAYEEHAR